MIDKEFDNKISNNVAFFNSPHQPWEGVTYDFFSQPVTSITSVHSKCQLWKLILPYKDVC